jgi:subfamily B ATP-binding cassette protein MsbA
MEETSVLASAMMEGLDGVKIVKIANREAQEEARVAEVIRRRQRHIIKGANARAYASPATEALMMMVTAAVIAYAGWRAQGGGMNGGEFTAFIVALAAASQSLRQLANLQTVMSEGGPAPAACSRRSTSNPRSATSPAPRPCRTGPAPSASTTSASPTAAALPPSTASPWRPGAARRSPWSAPRAAASPRP